MQCGHAANGDSDGVPICVICIGLGPDAERPMVPQPDLRGRDAKCTYCGIITPSGPHLAFYAYRPELTHDDYYNGCRGWN